MDMQERASQNDMIEANDPVAAAESASKEVVLNSAREQLCSMTRAEVQNSSLDSWLDTIPRTDIESDDLLGFWDAKLANESQQNFFPEPETDQTGGSSVNRRQISSFAPPKPHGSLPQSSASAIVACKGHLPSEEYPQGLPVDDEWLGHLIWDDVMGNTTEQIAQ